MKTRPNIFLILTVLIGMTVSGCSPFGNSTVADLVGGIADIFDGKSASEVNAGGTERRTTVPQSGSSADRHDVLMAAGTPFAQSSTITSPDGHEVIITLSGAE